MPYYVENDIIRKSRCQVTLALWHFRLLVRDLPLCSKKTLPSRQRMAEEEESLRAIVNKVRNIFLKQFLDFCPLWFAEATCWPWPWRPRPENTRATSRPLGPRRRRLCRWTCSSANASPSTPRWVAFLNKVSQRPLGQRRVYCRWTSETPRFFAHYQMCHYNQDIQ